MTVQNKLWTALGIVTLVAAASSGVIKFKESALALTSNGEEEEMVWIKPGTFEQGCASCDMEDALPIHNVTLDGFWMDKTPVTNEAFLKFALSTKYQTIAEKVPSAEDYPDVPKEELHAGSAVFNPPAGPVPLTSVLAWWKYQKDAFWHQPEGPGSSIDQRMDHPAVHIGYDDAISYCQWAGKRLPTEAEFEYAARGGLVGKLYSWGDDLKPNGQWPANLFQGHFPDHNTGEDGFVGTSPVRSFPPNGFGLYDVSGNVWQWTSDFYRPDYYQSLQDQGGETKNPHGPADSYDPGEPGVVKRVQRGGSFLCTAEYCTRYLVASRGKGEPSSSGSNVGFRCAK